MQTILLILSILLPNQFFFGTVTNNHFITSPDSQGYYMEQSLSTLNLSINDLVFIDEATETIHHITESTDIFIGIAENPHYIESITDTDHYYIEEDLQIHTGDLILIIDNQVYNISCIHN